MQAQGDWAAGRKAGGRSGGWAAGWGREQRREANEKHVMAIQ